MLISACEKRTVTAEVVVIWGLGLGTVFAAIFIYIWIYMTNCIFVFSNFYMAAFKRHYAFRLAIAPEFFYCSYMCLYYVCSGLLK